MTELPHDTKNAIIHLGSLLKRDDLLYSTVGFGANGFSTFIAPGWDEEETVKYNVHNPIQAALDNVLQEVCSDCLKMDSYFEDPFYTAMVKSYLEILIIQYGEIVPITRTIAWVCLKFDLTKHQICYKAEDGLLYKADTDSEYFNVETTTWFLKVKNGN